MEPNCLELQQKFCDEKFTNLDKKLQENHEILAEIHEVLLDRRTGLVIEVDRLKISHKKQVKFAWLMGGAIVTIITAYVTKILGL